MISILLDIIVPVFGLVGLGYATAKAGIFSDDAARGLSLFVFTIAIPALLFRSMATTDFPRPIAWDFLLSYYLATFAVYAATMVVARLALRLGLDEQALLGFGGAFSNTVLLGIPVILRAMGEAATLPVFLLITFHALLLFPTVTLLVEIGRGQGASGGRLLLNTVGQVTRNPILLGLLAGLAVQLSGWPLPVPIDRMADSLGQAALPCATFAMGASLARLRPAGDMPAALLMAGMKTVAHPLLVWILVTQIFSVPALWGQVAVLMAAMPCGVNVYLFAERYRAQISPAASAVVGSTALSVLTVTLLLYALGVRPLA